MGYDVYGINPKQNQIEPAILSKFNEDGWAQFDKMNDADKKEYFKAKDQHKKDNPGEYFRANVWFWRPIWNFVCMTCDFLSDEDRDAGCSNSGDKICKTKSLKIASRLRRLDKNGFVQEWEDEMMIIFEKAKKHNKKIHAELKVHGDKMNLKYGANTPPRDYDKLDYDTWSEIYAKEDWASSYPPSRDYIMEFSEFCEQSGGFEIC
jgi:hypothetical protein